MPEIAVIPAKDEHRADILRVLKPTNMHHIPSPEMPELDLTHAWVALVDGEVVGFSGIKMIDETTAKTTLLAVLPEHRKFGLGRMLQEKRMLAALELGATRLVTNADRPPTIAWYKKWFGYREIGKLRKEHEFGLPDVNEWTTLETDLAAWGEKHDS